MAPQAGQNSVSTRPQTPAFRPPAIALAPDPSSRAALSRCSGALEANGRGAEIVASRAPDAGERAALIARSDVLTGALVAAGSEEAQRLVALLFATIPSGRGEAETTREQLKLYGGLLCGFPGWAIAAACRGVVEAGAQFRPSAGDLSLRARKACAAAREEAAATQRLLDAKVVRDVAPEERARVGAGFAGLAAALAAKEFAA